MNWRRLGIACLLALGIVAGAVAIVGLGVGLVLALVGLFGKAPVFIAGCIHFTVTIGAVAWFWAGKLE